MTTNDNKYELTRPQKLKEQEQLFEQHKDLELSEAFDESDRIYAKVMRLEELYDQIEEVLENNGYKLSKNALKSWHNLTGWMEDPYEPIKEHHRRYEEPSRQVFPEIDLDNFEGEVDDLGFPVKTLHGTATITKEGVTWDG